MPVLLRPGSRLMVLNSTSAVYPSDGLGGTQAGEAGSDVDGAGWVLLERVLTDNRTSVDGTVIIESPGGEFTEQVHFLLTATGHKSERNPMTQLKGPFTARTSATTAYAIIVYRVLD